jgi:deaminated glutathione amidase
MKRRKNSMLNASARTIRIAAVQMISTPVLEENFTVARRLIGEAAQQGAQLVLLPEYWPVMGMHESDKVPYAEQFGSGPIQTFMADMARKHRLWLIGGTLPMAACVADKVLNTVMVYDPDGKCISRYDKIHLFSFAREQESYDEARTIVHGQEVTAFDTPFGRIGLSVCYDLRFPELYRALGNCTLMVVPAAFTYTTGKAHWEILLRARAIENQCYILAAGQGGQHPNGRRTWGHSMLIDPWGEVKAVLAEGEGMITGEIDPSFLNAMRENLPALQHRQL